MTQTRMTFLDDQDRFEFGANWKRFLSVLDDDRIAEAVRSLQQMLLVEDLQGLSFLDIGSGSGLFSLAARRLGARVYSFDYDVRSVACTRELRRRYYPNDPQWEVGQGSVLDVDYLSTLDQFDIVYSWGVLHHTGAMWLGIENALQRVAPRGQLYIAIYNDQGAKSRIWWFVKYIYNKLPRPLNTMYAYSLGLLANVGNIGKYTLRLNPMAAIRPLIGYKQRRGMSVLHDMVDWMGGFPFEFASYELLEQYLAVRDFELVNGVKGTSLGCHQMVFRRRDKASSCVA